MVEPFMLRYRTAILLICLVSVIVYAYGAWTSSLFEDEWYRTRELAAGTTRCPESNNIYFRPISGC
jgi:hypothetical protein